jgi:transcriptional regulator with XRE-family HTH domain
MALDTLNPLGSYLRDRRARLDPVALGCASGRRRTPGLRREEVAQRANISPTWYTWLEQGRGGAPSADVLNRIATGLMLTEPEREHLFMLGLGRPPALQYKPVDGVTPRLQRVLDAFEVSPAIIKTLTWDVIAWNRAAAILLTDYSKLKPRERNILRLIFADSRVRAAQADWQKVARFVVGAFRADATRAGTGGEAERLVEELTQLSPEFAAMWRDNEVHAHGEGLKRLHHPTLGVLEMEYSTFAVDGRPELGMMVYNLTSTGDADRVRVLITAQG